MRRNWNSGVPLRILRFQIYLVSRMVILFHLSFPRFPRFDPSIFPFFPLCDLPFITQLWLTSARFLKFQSISYCPVSPPSVSLFSISTDPLKFPRLPSYSGHASALPSYRFLLLVNVNGWVQPIVCLSRR